MRIALPLLIAAACCTAAAPAENADLAKLEPVTNPEGIAWADAESVKTKEDLEAQPQYLQLEADAQAVFKSPGFSAFSAFPQVKLTDGMVFGRDAEGFIAQDWESYLAGTAGDQLHFRMATIADAEGGRWSVRPWNNLECLPQQPTRCEATLTTGGFDLVQLREVDFATGALVQGGFSLPEARSQFRWIDADTALVAGDTDAALQTGSGAPRVLRWWKRGTALADAPIVFEGGKSDAFVLPVVGWDEGRATAFAVRRIAAPDRSAVSLLDPDNPNPSRRIIPVAAPERFDLVGTLEGRLILTASAPWQAGELAVHAGDLIAIDIAAARLGQTRAELIFRPGEKQALQTNQTSTGSATGAHAVYFTVLTDGTTGVFTARRDAAGWRVAALPLPANGVAGIHAVDPMGDHALLTWENPLEAPTLFELNGESVTKLRSTAAMFDGSRSIIERRAAKSRDGTMIPYWIVRPKSAPMDGSTPTLIHGYGAFSTSELPTYAPLVGKLWLERGGAYVITNVRGGGEFGPDWQAAAAGANKHRSVEDFIAVTEDVQRIGLTRPGRTAALGRSAGGLLVASAALQRPDLFAAVVAEDGLVDMHFEKRNSNAYYLSEFGDFDDPVIARALDGYDPVTLAAKGNANAPLLIVSRRNDQRVNAVGSRRLHELLQRNGRPSWLLEELQGDHGTFDPQLTALEYAFFWSRMAP